MKAALYPNFQKPNALVCARKVCDVLESAAEVLKLLRFVPIKVKAQSPAMRPAPSFFSILFLNIFFPFNKKDPHLRAFHDFYSYRTLLMISADAI